MGKALWISTGELSGDMQASSVLSALKKLDSSIYAGGVGGAYLAEAGQKASFNISALSVMGGAEIVSAIPRALRMLKNIKLEMEKNRPDAVLLVDAPEFNFRVAKIASRLGIPVYYFIPPKVWAWRSWRVRFLQKYVNRIFCILPFEEEYYRKHGVSVEYVGNPLVDRIAKEKSPSIVPNMQRIGILAGSRKKELFSLMPIFSEAARILHKKYPALSFVCLKAPNMDEDMLRSLWKSDIPLVMADSKAPYAFMKSCGTIMAASGTAVLETALCGTPTVVAYKLAKISGFIARMFIRVKWVSLPNLIMNREVFPECLMENATPQKIADCLGKWLDNPALYDSVRRDLTEVAQRCGNTGAAERAARAIFTAMGGVL